ncbi:MAG TPA: nitrate- and nitrite sensing domain-containing protein [Actinomycetes bacterium]|jgi:HAMP domain-containing protein|nr:nitrate- and nitrite sensing domain-containing protein [Actinomycetes bacterium]
MLNDLPIRPKLALILIIPAVALVALAGLQVGSAVSTSRQADRVTKLTEFALRGTALAHELQKERGLTVRYLLAPKAGADRRALPAQRGPVDRALAAYRASVGVLDEGALAPSTRDKLRSASNRLDGLAQLRRDADGRVVAVSAALDFYNGTIADLLNTNREIAAGIADRELAQSVGAFVALSRIKELAALERELVTSVLARGRFATGQYRRFTSTLATRAVLLSEFRGAANDVQRAQFVDTLVGPEVQRAKELQASVVASEGSRATDVDPAEWWSVTTAEIELLHQVEGRLGAASVARSQAIESDARERATFDGIVVALVLALAVGLSLLVARSMLRPLGLLKATAEDVAQVRLPGVVEKLQRSEPIDLDAESRPIGIGARDEIGQVARAFDTVHSVAVRVAAEEAALRRSVGELFLHLGRRLQALVYRQLELLDQLERTEVDSKQLRSLFLLDHLATRMRRNADNLLVLSGAEPVRRWSDPIPLATVIRAASSEIEDFSRVAVMPMADARIVGQHVSDVIHLLAELIENAATFSPPGTRVQVTGEPTPHGYLVEIEDRGIGMSHGDLAEINEQLASPPAVDFTAARRLGFDVVARLAVRHGIKVRLRPSWFGGVTALVLLPPSLLSELLETGLETAPEDAGAGRGPTAPPVPAQAPAPALETAAPDGASPNGWRSHVRRRGAVAAERLPGPGAVDSPVMQVDDGPAD